jgi:hypothetical protein
VEPSLLMGEAVDIEADCTYGCQQRIRLPADSAQSLSVQLDYYCLGGLGSLHSQVRHVGITVNCIVGHL